MAQGKAPPQISASLVTAVLWFVAGWVLLSLLVATVLESYPLASSFLSGLWWNQAVTAIGGKLQLQDGTPTFAVMPFSAVSMWAGAGMIAGCLVAGCLVRLRTGGSLGEAMLQAARHTGFWGCVAGGWSLVWLMATASRLELIGYMLAATIDLWLAVAAAGWLSAVLSTGPGTANPQADGTSSKESRRWLWVSCLAIVVYTLVYTAMNWEMYWGLLVPHGDSAMYEEHLWNLLHGKGFRSYLDQGLFLGEHIQFIHLGLIPVYVLWPSHLLLELFESLALALTALPVYWITRRHTQSDKVAMWMAVATLLYSPLHFLDIAIDFKTFRPISFGVPLLLFAIDQMERRRLVTMAMLFVVTLTAKEDFAIVIAPLGLWLAVTSWRAETTAENRRQMIVGLLTGALATVYLALAVKVLIPWFRSGDTVHYARYFSRFGETPTEIVTNMLTNPGLLFGELVTAGTTVYALRVIVPLGGTPLLSPSRLLVGAPLFLLLCLNELAQGTPAPVHHFHAPLVPIVLWAAAAGLPNLAKLKKRFPVTTLSLARFAMCCALTTGALASFHPLSRKFWDPGRVEHWERLFVPGERAAQFAKIESRIPLDARVASTDFVHPRYTHHERSYDYSGYLRKVAGYEERVPDDTDYIVIDTQHPYSEIKSPDQVRELREHPDDWELLPDETEGFFIVLKRRPSSKTDH
ncbi:MAG: DUF2079 domain-containing protein [Planctomycetaceae bacterium]|nr:DUF2079 domain-containing protein [Planctomycetaceae bacterium]